VHRTDKRLLPAARAFREFLLRDGARLIEEQMAASPAQRRKG
jgi:hypothetical protein